jgi:hypothetical protein
MSGTFRKEQVRQVAKKKVIDGAFFAVDTWTHETTPSRQQAALLELIWRGYAGKVIYSNHLDHPCKVSAPTWGVLTR